MNILKSLENNYVIVSNEEANERTFFIAEGLIKSAEERGDTRTEEQIYAATKPSAICEVGLCKMLPNGKLNEQEHDYKNVHSYGYDVYDGDVKFEVKWMLSQYAGTGLKPKEYYTFSKKIADNIIKRKIAYDYLICMSFDVQGENYKVFPRMLINPNTFAKYTKHSIHPKPGREFVYWHPKASKESKNNCIVFK